MSESGPLILLAILVISLLLLVGVLPYALRWLAVRNRTKWRQINRDKAVLDHSLLESAERLRPFHKMKAHSYQEQREAVRHQLIEAREERRGIDRHLAQLRLTIPPLSQWPGEFFLRQPANYITIPADSFRLGNANRSVDKVRKYLESAAVQQATLNQITQALEQAATTLHEQTLPMLGKILQVEKSIGLELLKPFEERLHELRQGAANLTGSLRAGPAAEDHQTDKLALELEAITSNAKKLEDEIRSLHQKRVAIDEKRSQTEGQHLILLKSLPPDRVPENLAPMLEHVDYLLKSADARRNLQEFEESETSLNMAAQFTELNLELFNTARELDQLVEIQQISPLANQIRLILNQWRPIIEQAHNLVLPQNENVSASIQPLLGTTNELKKQARELMAQNQHLFNQVEGKADQALDSLAEAWNNLQAIMPLGHPDPLAIRYHALWAKREASRGIPVLLEEFIKDAEQLTNQVIATASTLKDQLRYVQNTLGRLPKILADAQQWAEDWRSLQLLAEKLAALRVSLENLSQDSFTVNTRDAVNDRLAEFQQQAEQVTRIQEELRFEAYEIGRLDRIIRDHWDAIQENPAGLSEAKMDRAVKMTDTQYERALSAERCQDARAALEKCLTYVENLALN